jgi:hypothetical protein
MTDDDKPIGFDTLREAMAVIIEHEASKRREQASSREKLSLPKSEPQRRPPAR